MSGGSCRSGGNTCGNFVVNLSSGVRRSAHVLIPHRRNLDSVSATRVDIPQSFPQCPAPPILPCGLPHASYHVPWVATPDFDS